jgi:hypothetical protein
MPRHKWRIWLLLVVLAGIVLLGLAIYFARIWVNNGRRPDLGILSTPGCTPPCWNGLYPGMKISRSELLTVLNGLADVRGIVTSTELPGDITFSWCPVGDGITEYTQCNSYCVISHWNNRIDIIHVDIRLELTLGAIIQAMGQPEYFDYTNYGDEVSIYLRYPKVGCNFGLRYDEPNNLTFKPSDLVTVAIYTIDDMHKLGYYRQSWSGFGPVILSPIPTGTPD